jgi:predicted transcriptional regulator
MDKYIIFYLLTGTKGGINRTKILKVLEREPMNANRLKQKLRIDYKTIQHHLRTLEKHKFIGNSRQKYGALYYLTDEFKFKQDVFNEIWEKLNKESVGGLDI